MSTASEKAPLMRRLRILLPIVIMFAFILIPFALWGQRVDDAVFAWNSTSPVAFWFAVCVVGLLTLDVVGPIPSSFVAIAAGVVLGFWGGTIAVFFGLLIGSGFGYWLGRRVGRPILRRTLGTDQLPQAGAGQGVALVATRAVPVLSEAMTLTAGATGMPFYRFMILSALANAGVASAYAALGAFSASTNTFLWVFVASILVPGVAYLAYKALRFTTND